MLSHLSPFGKSANQRRHAKRRASERYGINLNRAGQREIRETIRTGNAQLVARESLRVSIYDLEFQGQTIRVVYDKQRRNVVTFLPLGAEAAAVEDDQR